MKNNRTNVRGKTGGALQARTTTMLRLTFSLALFYAAVPRRIDAQSGVLSDYQMLIRVERSKNKASYESQSQGAEAYAYKQASQENTVVKTVVGTGMGYDPIKDTRREANKAVPGINANGHSTLTLSRDAEGNISLSIDFLEILPSGQDKQIPLQYTVPAVFTKGSWEEYAQGKDIELQLTDEGKSQSLNAQVGAWKKGLELSFREAVLHDPTIAKTNADVSPINIEKFDFTWQVVLRGNKTRLDLEEPPGVLEASLTINNR